uniref:Serine/threonine protein phosphatase PrpC n=1 Tax=Candidatus Kentrum sp. DK TaxID=2126562 RepID=A0A450SVC4_9GAMM|nr:MAG: Serine/threonine protein phosphatase PrpC [Candidatus Kentron sp. DK]
MPITYDEFAITSRGGRAHNEDHYGLSELGSGFNDGSGCWVVADGLGGHSGGETASRIAVSNLLAHFKEKAGQRRFGIEEEALGAALKDTQSVIMARKEREPRFSQMYTTVVLLVTDGVMARWAHVGDSRLYYFHRGKIASQTEDHSVSYMLYRAGEIDRQQIRTHEDRNRLLRSLGARKSFQPEIAAEPVVLQPSDAFLLCTDGFWEYVLEKEMEADLAASETAEDWAKKMEHRVLARVRAKSHREHDNYTAITVRIKQKNVQSQERATMPEAKRCDKGHFYDPDKYAECPLCGGLLDTGMGKDIVEKDAPISHGKTIMMEFNPPVGWLVCTEGPDRGRDYPLFTHRNFIGRGTDAGIRITDSTVSRECHGIVSHDPVNNSFHLSLGQSRGMVFYKEKAVLTSVELSPYDTFRLGNTTLLFVPLCGQKFQWKELTS